MYDVKPNMVLASAITVMNWLQYILKFAKSHIQICIRNLNCIKGFFLPRQEIDFPEWPEKEKAIA
jgi:hypothetical protein